jgi:hypothetical protein
MPPIWTYISGDSAISSDGRGRRCHAIPVHADFPENRAKPFGQLKASNFKARAFFLLACSGQNGPDVTLPSKAFTALIFSESPISLFWCQFLVFCSMRASLLNRVVKE